VGVADSVGVGVASGVAVGVGVAMGSAWLSGINLYATVVTLGLLQRYHLVRLPGDLVVQAGQNAVEEFDHRDL